MNILHRGKYAKTNPEWEPRSVYQPHRDEEITKVKYRKVGKWADFPRAVIRLTERHWRFCPNSQKLQLNNRVTDEATLSL